MNQFIAVKTLALAGLLALAAGCASNDPEVIEGDFGNSVRNMVQGQAADPSKMSAPEETGVEGADGPLMNEGLKAMRGSVAKPENVKQDIVINVAQ